MTAQHPLREALQEIWTRRSRACRGTPIQYQTCVGPRTRTVHPLRAALQVAEQEYQTRRCAADAALDRLDIGAWRLARDALLVSESRLIRARAALAGSDCPREWHLSQTPPGAVSGPVVVGTASEAASAAAEYGEGAWLVCPETGEAVWP